jgi:hypothetical protein
MASTSVRTFRNVYLYVLDEAVPCRARTRTRGAGRRAWMMSSGRESSGWFSSALAVAGSHLIVQRTLFYHTALRAIL